jgi:hypothetical protein
MCAHKHGADLGDGAFVSTKVCMTRGNTRDKHIFSVHLSASAAPDFLDQSIHILLNLVPCRSIPPLPYNAAEFTNVMIAECGHDGGLHELACEHFGSSPLSLWSMGMQRLLNRRVHGPT